MDIIAFGIGGFVGTIIVWQLATWIRENRLKNARYQAAVLYCQRVRKPLLIVGGPWGARPFRRWLKLPAHPNGDVCLDISPSAIQGHPNALIGTVTDLPFEDKVFGAAFASHLLEHLPDTKQAKKAFAELNRVADHVYIVSPYRQSILAWLIPDHHLWVWEKGHLIYFKERGNDHKEAILENYST